MSTSRSTPSSHELGARRSVVGLWAEMETATPAGSVVDAREATHEGGPFWWPSQDRLSFPIGPPPYSALFLPLPDVFSVYPPLIWRFFCRYRTGFSTIFSNADSCPLLFGHFFAGTGRFPILARPYLPLFLPGPDQRANWRFSRIAAGDPASGSSRGASNGPDGQSRGLRTGAFHWAGALPKLAGPPHPVSWISYIGFDRIAHPPGGGQWPRDRAEPDAWILGSSSDFFPLVPHVRLQIFHAENLEDRYQLSRGRHEKHVRQIRVGRGVPDPPVK